MLLSFLGDLSDFKTPLSLLRGFRPHFWLVQCALPLYSGNRKHWPKVLKRKPLLNDHFNNPLFSTAQLQSGKTPIINVIFLNVLSSPLFETRHRTKIKINQKKVYSGNFRFRTKECPLTDLQCWVLKFKSGQVEILPSSLPFGARYILCCRVSANSSKIIVPSCYYSKSAMALLWSKWQIQQQLFDRDLQKLPRGC